MMKKHLLLLLSVCTVTPVMYGGEEPAVLEPITGPKTQFIEQQEKQDTPEVTEKQPTWKLFHQLFDRVNSLTHQLPSIHELPQPVRNAKINITAAAATARTVYNAVAKAMGKVVNPPIAAGNFVWAKVINGKDAIKNVSLATWTKIKTIPNSTKNIAGKVWNTILGKVPEFEEGFYWPGNGADENEQKINGLHQAFAKQLKSENAIYSYIVKHATITGATAGAIGGGIIGAFGQANPTLTKLGAGALLTVGLASTHYLVKRSQPAIALLNSGYNRIATNVLQAGLTKDQVAAAYNKACSNNHGILASLNPINRISHSHLHSVSEAIRERVRQ